MKENLHCGNVMWPCVGKLMKKLPSQNSAKRAVCVRNSGLCVFLFPTKEEEKQLDQFSRRRGILENLSSDSMFCEAVRIRRADEPSRKMNLNELAISRQHWFSYGIKESSSRNISNNYWGEPPSDVWLGVAWNPLTRNAIRRAALADLSEEDLKELKSELKSLKHWP